MSSEKIEEKSLSPYISTIGACAIALGTELGWGSLVVTSNTYLYQAGPLGSILGVCLGTIVMYIMAKNYFFLTKQYPDCGGAYTFSKKSFGYDHAFITGWYLALVYLAILWANATSIPLFARIFIGQAFQFGFKYTIFGYDIYLGEALVSSFSLVLFGWILAKYKRFSVKFNTIMVMSFFTIILGCFIYILKKNEGINQLNPAYIPDTNNLLQVIHIACISPWAFIGFENISNASEEFKFSKEKIFNILVIAILSATLLYIVLILLSVTVYPARYVNWLAYIKDLDNCKGIEHFPVFYVVHHYLGDHGYYALLVALLALIFTSLFGNTYALSRLFYRLAKDRIIPERFTKLDDDNVPYKAIWLVIGLSIFVPFMGRTAIGWIVDVTTIGATLIYGFVSLSAWKIAKELGDEYKSEKKYGIIGIVIMSIFGIYLLLPNIVTIGEIETETYLLFTLWSILGLIYFRQLLKQDNKANETRFGKSIIVWGILLVILICTSLTWMLDITQNATEKIIKILESGESLNISDYSILQSSVRNLYHQNLFNIIIFVIMITLSLVLLISNYSFIVKRTHKLEIEHETVEAERKRQEEELEISQMIQASVLPDNFPDRDRFDLYASMTPCKGVGGDYYDFFRVDSTHEAVIIADVSGKGITAAMFMMNARAAIKEAVLSGKPLVEAMERANIELCEHNKARMFITVFIAILDLNTGELKCINAGHNPPLINRNGSWEYLKIKHSPAISVAKHIKFTEVVVKLEHKDSLFLYTDGVTEAKDINDHLYGEEKLINFISKQEYKPRIILNNTLDELKAYAGDAPQSDDITMVMFKYL